MNNLILKDPFVLIGTKQFDELCVIWPYINKNLSV